MSTTILRDCSKNIPHFVADSGETTGLKWAAASLPNYTLGASGSLSGSSVSVTGLSGTDFIVHLANATPTNTGSLNVTLNSDTTGGRYYKNDSNGSAANWFVRSIGASTGYYIGFKIDGGNGGGAVLTGESNLGGGGYNQTTAITSIQLITSAGTWSAGTYAIYQR